LTIEHVAITDPQIHEPKGASTAANKSVYYADGAGSGSWTDFHDIEDRGWEFQKHSTTQVFTTTASRISIDGGGTNSTTTYTVPSIAGSTTLWDTTTGFLNPVAAGDCYMVRFEFPVTAVTGSPAYFELQVDIGGGGTPSNVILHRAFSLYKTPTFYLSGAFPLFTTATSLANGFQFFLNVDAATSATVTGANVFVMRTYRSL